MIQKFYFSSNLNVVFFFKWSYFGVFDWQLNKYSAITKFQNFAYLEGMEFYFFPNFNSFFFLWIEWSENFLQCIDRFQYDTKKFKFWDSAFVVCPGLSVQFISETIRDWRNLSIHCKKFSDHSIPEKCIMLLSNYYCFWYKRGPKGGNSKFLILFFI
jgi:hypothetical protein